MQHTSQSHPTKSLGFKLKIESGILRCSCGNLTRHRPSPGRHSPSKPPGPPSLHTWPIRLLLQLSILATLRTTTLLQLVGVLLQSPQQPLDFGLRTHSLCEFDDFGVKRAQLSVRLEIFPTSIFLQLMQQTFPGQLNDSHHTKTIQFLVRPVDS